ncbi:MAG TPA: hypothetical protein VJ583_11490 [Nitrososphaeraceae archaeon]|nr:hypothetical protein [Nitrososphaeraceae archaeon]
MVAINPKIKMMRIINAYNGIRNNDLNFGIVKKPITITKLLQIIQQFLS